MAWEINKRFQSEEDFCDNCGSKEELVVCNNDKIYCRGCFDEIDDGTDNADHIIMCIIVPEEEVTNEQPA